MADFNRQPTIFPNGIDLKKQEAKNLVLQNINARTFDASYLYKSETVKVPGLIIFDPEDKHAKIWVDNNWKPIAFFGEGEGGTKLYSKLTQLLDVNIDSSSLAEGDMIVWNPNIKSISGEPGAWVKINKSEIKPNPEDFISSSIKLNTQDGIIGGGKLANGLTIGLEKIHESQEYFIKVLYDEFGRVIDGEKSINLTDVIGLSDEFDNYLKLNSTDLQTVTGPIEFNDKISFNKGIEFKGLNANKKATIELDEENNALQIESNVYTTGNISAGGKVSTTAGGGGGASTLGELINVDDAVDNKNESNNIQVLGRYQDKLGWESVPLNYIHRQNISSDTWIIPHNLHRYPSVTVIDSAGSLVQGEIIYDSLDQVTLRFSCSFGGKAELR